MVEIFKKYIQEKIKVSDQELEAACSLLSSKKIQKGQMLLSKGEQCRCVYFVGKGCLRSYVIDNKGKEHIIQFAPENWWVSDENSFHRKEPAMFYIDAIEDAEVLIAEKDFYEKVPLIIPEFNGMLQGLVQNKLRSYQKRLINALSVSAEERYLDFIKTYPSLSLRVPQKMIASYLGLTPESLSRVRKELVK
jgi:CRP-like cAMP-binding protein